MRVPSQKYYLFIIPIRGNPQSKGAGWSLFKGRRILSLVFKPLHCSLFVCLAGLLCLALKARRLVCECACAFVLKRIKLERMYRSRTIYNMLLTAASRFFSCKFGGPQTPACHRLMHPYIYAGMCVRLASNAWDKTQGETRYAVHVEIFSSPPRLNETD